MNYRKLLDVTAEVVLLLLALVVNIKFVYILFAICVFPTTLKSKISLKKLWNVAILSVIVPDNNLTLFFIAIPSLITIYRFKEKILSKANLPTAFGVLLISLGVLSSICHLVPWINITIAVVFLSSFIFALFILGVGGLEKIIYSYASTLDRVIRIEIIATAINFILLMLGRLSGDDWSTGTFGVAQQSQLYLIFVFYLVVLMTQFYNKAIKRTSFLVKASLCFLCALSTFCWTLLGVTGLVFFIWYTTILDKKILIRLGKTIIIFALFGLFIGGKVADSAIGNQIVRIGTDFSYMMYRVSKLDTYYKTFVVIPQRDIEFFFIGNGVGWYSSRAALTCSGSYVGGYKNLFSPSMSEYTKKYIFPSLDQAYKKGETDAGSVLARPYSSIISVMGETGYLGMMLFLFTMCMLIKKYGKASRLLIFIWISACFVENYLEYPKIILFLLMCIYSAHMFEGKRDSQNEQINLDG